jgi:hypothetical protein
MSAPPSAIPYEAQTDPQANRGCGAACLSMVYKSFGKDTPQAAIWPLISRANRFGSVASTTHLMTLHALSQDFSAVAIQARHPIQVLRRCLDAGIRVILNHRLKSGVSSGHYSVLVDLDDKEVVLHDPFLGPSRRLSHAELIELWQPSAPNSEIVGNTLIAIAAEPMAIPACEFCHTPIPSKVNCPRCGKAVSLDPAATLGCIRDGCIARMWNYVCCPFCDSLFTETGKSAPDAPATASAPPSNLPEPPNLDKVIAEIEKFCSHILSLPGMAKHPDVMAQIDFMRAKTEMLKPAQIEELAGIKAHSDRLMAFGRESREKVEAHRKKVEEINAPLPPLDGDALGAALLKALGFK